MADKWEIDRDDIQIGDRVGVGNFGEVFKGKWRGQVEVAVKTLKDEQGGDEFNKEAEVLKTLHHPNLVQVQTPNPNDIKYRDWPKGLS